MNEDGCTKDERTRLYPKISWRGNIWIAEVHTENIDVACYGSTRQEVIDLWNKRGDV